MTKCIDPTAMYNSVRHEILDQKNSQFQLFAAVLTLNAAVLAYGSVKAAAPLIYIVPILMNVLALTIILDKAISIQRMVGYLQLMESETSERVWMWEYHLNLFRALPAISSGHDPSRKHKYIRNIALMLITLNGAATALYWWGPTAIEFRHTTEYDQLREIYGAITFCIVVLNFLGIVAAVHRWIQLVYGIHTASAIRERWKKVF